MSKRRRFVLSSIILSLGFVGIQIFQDQYRFISIFVLGILSILLFAWSLYEGLGLNMTLTNLILPFFYTIGVGFFWFLLPANIFTQIPIVILYGIGIYALCLTANIYTVSAIRTIALLRAARGVGFVLTLLTFFLIFNAIVSLKIHILYSSLLVFASSIFLYIQGLWSTILDKGFNKELVATAIVSSLVSAEMSLIIHFWPVTVVVGSLYLTISGYTLLGLGQAKLEGRLFSQTIKEHLTLGFFVFIGMFLATRWSG